MSLPCGEKAELDLAVEIGRLVGRFVHHISSTLGICLFGTEDNWQISVPLSFASNNGKLDEQDFLDQAL